MGQQKTSINLSSSHPGFLDPQPTQHHIRASAAENQQPDHLHRPRLHSMRWVSRRMCDGKRKHVFETFAQICADTCLVRIPNLCGETAACVQSKKKQETCKFSTNIKFQSRKDKPRWERRRRAMAWKSGMVSGAKLNSKRTKSSFHWPLIIWGDKWQDGDGWNLSPDTPISKYNISPMLNKTLS